MSNARKYCSSCIVFGASHVGKACQSLIWNGLQNSQYIFPVAAFKKGELRDMRATLCESFGKRPEGYRVIDLISMGTSEDRPLERLECGAAFQKVMEDWYHVSKEHVGNAESPQMR